MIGKRFRFLAQHGRALFVWMVIIVAGVQLWLVPFGVGAAPKQPASSTLPAVSSSWTMPTMVAELHYHLRSTHKH